MVNGDQQLGSKSGKFETMVKKSTDATWKRWTLIAGTIVAIGGAAQMLTPAVAPLLGIVMENDLKWRTEKLLALEREVAAKEARLAVLEAEVIRQKETIQDLKSDIRELRH